ncbi:MAG: helix-turn-helix domain-containing protein [Burkholderiales bacterium]|jgi:hypothetical protein|nr:helix-turn-helix domain-containing protein [Burkholderiales bacterium]
MSKTQQQQILEHLRKRSITQVEAFSKYGITRLPSAIFKLRAVGHKIDMRMADVKVGGVDRRLARYTLTREAK